MKHGYVVTLLAALGACVGASVEVTPLHPTPRALTPRTVDAVKVLESRPDGGVAVYNLVASGGGKGELEAAVKEKAASLGCDGVVITVRAEPTHRSSGATTGELNDHRDPVAGHVTAMCIVLPAVEGPPATATTAAGSS
jgi:hypothetical protein